MNVVLSLVYGLYAGSSLFFIKKYVYTFVHLVWIDMEELSSARDTPQFSVLLLIGGQSGVSFHKPDIS